MPPTVAPGAATLEATQTVADAMITNVKVSNAGATVRELRALLDDEHVHAAVIVEDGVLLAVVDRVDLEGGHRDDALAAPLGSLQSRVITPEADLDDAQRLLRASGRRRLAVVSADGMFRGLLCLKRTRTGFCSDVDVRARGVLDEGCPASKLGARSTS